MFKKYKVFAESDEMNVTFDCRTVEQASEKYFLLMDMGGFKSGHVMDNETGEIYAHFDREHGGLTCWVAE
jgi:hypothetical protein